MVDARVSDDPTSPPSLRRHRILRRVALSTAAVIILLAVGVLYLYIKFNHNLHSSPLDLGGPQAVETPDAVGQTPENILLIGSDTRSTAQDCALGGDCGPGGNADVEMVLHISADRSNATVMSIPRDTVVNVPSCTADGTTYPAETNVQITSSLQHGGPGCTVAAVHQLTGITIDHFVMIDFQGVVNLTNDVGGVPICVSANVYDPDSHLRLTAGTHVIQGLTALEFLRTRHGFSDGSDLYRTQATHMYMSALIQKMESADTLANPDTLYHLADDATSALTVDPGLDSIGALMSLGETLKSIPTDRITFVTMPTVPSPLDPTAWVAPAEPGAGRLFDDILTDTPLSSTNGTIPTTASAAAAPMAAAASAPSVAPAPVQVSVENGSGIIGRAGDVATALDQAGFSAESDTDAPTTSTTTLSYPAGDQAQAVAVADALSLPSSAVQATGSASSLVLILGTDWPSGTTYPSTGPSASLLASVASAAGVPSASVPSASVPSAGVPSGAGVPSAVATSATSAPASNAPATPPAGSAPENASTTGECAQVDPAYTF